MNYEKAVLEGLKSFGGAATTKQLGKYVSENYSDLVFDWNYRMRWAQQSLKLDGLVISASQFKDNKWRLA